MKSKESSLGSKSCNTCRDVKPLSEFNIINKKTNPRPDYYCRSCRSEYRKKWYDERGGKEKQNKYWFGGAKEKSRWERIQREYNLSRDEYDALLTSQNNKCAICQTEKPEDRHFDVDHDHTTGRVRGLLCNRCNRGLGYFNDDFTLIRTALNYLAS